mgnify:CR=1 FL=1|jgi:hypothetical protein
MGVYKTMAIKNANGDCCFLECKNALGLYGHNAYPIVEGGRCCNDCNKTRIIPERIKRLKKNLDEKLYKIATDKHEESA